MMLTFFLGIHFATIGLSGAQIGIIFALYSIMNLITIIPSGFFNDKIHSKTLILIALILSGTRLLGYAYTTSFIPLAALSILGGMGTAIYKTSAESLFHKVSEKKEVSKKIAVYQGILYTGMAGAMILSGYLLEINYTFNQLFKIIGTLFILSGLLSIFILPKNDTIKLELLEYKKELWQKKVIAFLTIIFIFSLHIGAEVTSYGLFLKEYLQLNSLQIGSYMGIAIFFMGITVILIDKHLKKITPKLVVILGLLISGIFHTIMIVKNPYLSFVFRTLHEIGDAAVFFAIYYIINNFFNLKRIGGLNAIQLLILNIGITIGSLIFGPIGEMYGYHIAMATGGLSILLSLFVAIPYINIITSEKE